MRFVRNQEDLWAIIMLGCEHSHKSEPGGTVEIAWIEQNCGHNDSPLELL